MIKPLDSPSQSNTGAPSNRQLHWPSALTVLGGILAFWVFLIGSGFFLFSGLASFLTPGAVETSEAGMLFSYAAASFVLGLLVFPAVILAVRRLNNRAPTNGILAARLTRRQIVWLLVVYLMVLMGGILLSNTPRLDWLFMPLLNVLGLSLPVIFLFWLGAKNLPVSSTQRNWTVFGFSFTISPLIIVVIELLVIFTGIILVSVLLVFIVPDFPSRIEEFARMMETAQDTMQLPQEEVASLLQSPLVIGLLLFFAAGLVPLVEESIKPLGVWLLAGRKLTPQDGWLLGLLSGAGFALIENLGNLAIGQGWTALALARGGATALHMFNSAIIGYTFVLSRQQKRWWKVILAFLGTIALHAVWNGIAVMAMVSTFQDLSAAEMGWPIGYLILLGLATTGTIWGIHRVNKKLVAEAQIENLPEVAAEAVTLIESEKQIND
ncbi:MAG: PrsW family intramembrane metalloprotease [Anaerolineales bacterium]|nr:PrsW family intramembrane metalloprotease [Anaerolineales bacterium]